MNKNQDKVIFLDIDGVLVPKTTVHNTLDDWYGEAYPFNTDCVIVLNEILHKTKADIVLISNWQFAFDLKTIRKIFKHNGVDKAPVACSNAMGNDKTSDVENYIYENEIERYVVLDDDDLSRLGDNFIQIDKYTGLTEEYTAKIIAKLNKKG